MLSTSKLDLSQPPVRSNDDGNESFATKSQSKRYDPSSPLDGHSPHRGSNDRIIPFFAGIAILDAELGVFWVEPVVGQPRDHDYVRTRAIPPASGFVQRSRGQRAPGACRRRPGRPVPSL